MARPVSNPGSTFMLFGSGPITIRCPKMPDTYNRHAIGHRFDPGCDTGFGPLELVLPNSPIAYRKAVYRLAFLFKREFGYDFTQYGYEGQEDDDSAVAFLWGDEVAWGACCFRWREWEDCPHGYSLQWIWMHPYMRRQGHLSRAWPFFQKHFGRFWVEYPLSDAMNRFLERHHWPEDAAI